MATYYSARRAGAAPRITAIHITRIAVMAFLPIVKMRDIYPQLAAPLAALALAVLAFPLLIGRNQRIGRDLQWWWCIPGLLAFQLVVALIFARAPMSALGGNAVTIAGAVLAGVAMHKKRFPLQLVVETVLGALACLLIASTALYAMGIQSAHLWADGAGYSTILREFGLWVERSGMPMTGGGVSHSALSAVVAAGAVLTLVRRFSVLAIVAFPCALWGLAVGDGRAAMLGGVLGVVGALLRGPWVRWAALGPIAGAFFLSTAAAMLPRNWALLVSRTGDVSEIAGGNGRAEIWQAAFDYLMANPFAALTGMGQYGQITSGIVRTMGLHTEYGDRAQLTMHNVGVQALIDGGLIGLGVTALWLFRACKGLEQTRTGTAMMLAMMVAGVFDVWMTHYNDAGFFALALLGMAGLAQLEHIRNGRGAVNYPRHVPISP